MPTETAAIICLSGLCLIMPFSTIQFSASTSATQAPVMEAVRVPPSACSTSQSTVMECSPSAVRSTAARRERAISREISRVRPLCLPEAASRFIREWVERGSMPYSAVTQPWFFPFRKRGTLVSTLAVQSTRVLPNSTSTEPSACLVKLRVMVTGRSCAALRSLGRDMERTSGLAQIGGGL